ncbi:MAG: hypothetical protein EOM37_09040 [Proteobacteria bacterium]|nr:hypothetical protein [Pseudomonadota bacterium]
MKLFFYRGQQPNFGDELNLYLMPKVFPEFFDDDESNLFLGIGSIQDNRHPTDCDKIVFGSGYGGYLPAPVLDAKWHVYCVRGPMTARTLGLSSDKVAADSAVLINRFRQRDVPTSTEKRVSFIPHFQSIPRGNWEKACAEAGIYFIDPRNPVETVMSEMEASSVVLAEAMHGAIVADALRVPWIPLQPISAGHRAKWHDWASALDMTLPIYNMLPSSLWEAAIALRQRTNFGNRGPGMFKSGGDPAAQTTKGPSAARNIVEMTRGLSDPLFIHLASQRLQRLARKEPMLSSDAALDRALDKLESAATQIKKDYGHNR